MGFVAGGIPGAIAGGVAGVVSGAISGIADIYAGQDETARGIRNDLVQGSLQQWQEDSQRGIGIAGSREQILISFSTLLGDEDAQRYLAKMSDFAQSTPFGYDQLANISKTLLAYGFDSSQLLDTFRVQTDADLVRGIETTLLRETGLLTKVGDAGAALAMDEDGVNRIAISLGRMQTTDKATLEYLNPILERGIDAIKYLRIANSNDKDYSRDEILGLMQANDEQLQIMGITLTTSDIYEMIISARYTVTQQTVNDALAQAR